MLKVGVVVFLLFVSCGFHSLALSADEAASPLLAAPHAAAEIRMKGVAELLTDAAQKWDAPHRLFIYVNSDFGREPKLLPATQFPPDSPPDMGAPEGIAAAYGLVPQWIGHLLAIAPATMTVLNTDPGLSELPLDQLESMHPIPPLLGSLTNEQFGLLATTGLGMADLTPDQQALFRALLPSPFEIVASSTEEPQLTMQEQAAPGGFDKLQKQIEEFRKEVITVPTDEVLANVKLHAFLDEAYVFDSDRGSYEFDTHGSKPYSSGEKKLTINDTFGGQQPIASDLSKLLVNDEPNQPKPGDINFRSKELNVTVSIRGVKTVEDVVQRIAKATRFELYADDSYAEDRIIIDGDPKATPNAVDLLQALALCVAGAWRQVGPAYVLTNDKAGFGARQQFLKDVVATWSNHLQEADADVSGRMHDLDWMHNLYPFVGDAIDIPRDQLLKICSDGEKTHGHVKWSDIPTPVQMALTQQMTEEISSYDGLGNDPQYKSYTDTAAAITDIQQSVKPDSAVDVQVNMQIALELPETGVMSFQEYRLDTSRTAGQLPVSADKIALSQKTRGVICTPKTTAEAIKIVDLLPGMGFNTLFLDAFHNGRAYFPNSAITPETDDAAGVLNAAITEGAAKGIAVYAVVDTLCWRKDGASLRPSIWTSQYDEDLNIFGEPANVGVERRSKDDVLNIQTKSMPIATAGQSWVSPLDPSVRKALPTMAKDLAEMPGLAGLMFQDTAPPGYDGEADGLDTDLDLGFTVANRLAYLRAFHRDPIDMGGFGQASLWLPFEGWSGYPFQFQINGFESSFFSPETNPWSKFRSDGDLALLKDCYLAAFNSKPKLPLLMRERHDGMTFDPWKDASIVNQIGSDAVQAQPFNYINDQSILTVPIASVMQTKPQSLTWWVNSVLGEFSNKAGGAALDLEEQDSGESAVQLLKDLKPYMAAP
jgi:hypothetical protein